MPSQFFASISTPRFHNMDVEQWSSMPAPRLFAPEPVLRSGIVNAFNTCKSSVLSSGPCVIVLNYRDARVLFGKILSSRAINLRKGVCQILENKFRLSSCEPGRQRLSDAYTATTSIYRLRTNVRGFVPYFTH